MGGLTRMGSPALRLRRIAVYLAFTLLLMPVQALGLLLRQGWVARLPRFYHRGCCRILGLRVRRIGRPTSARPVLFASNHISYLDITVLGSLLSASFIAKREVREWPLFGWLARLQRSIFIDRQVRSTRTQRDSIAARLAAREALILFPEGTSGNGNRVLPFKSALFGVAEQPGSGTVAVQPVSIAYTRLDGIPIGRLLRPLFAWYGDMAMAPHLWTVLGLGTVEVVVEFHPPASLAQCGSRKALARYCEEQVGAGLASALSGRRAAAIDPTARPREHSSSDAAAAALG
ncbi:MAG TPA: lysophospholipid acyltransferase family protein [Stellaceae bacterium]|nr:lysophospholipid acyltransferase family protein [Stellaceae bacterium]